MIANTSFEVIVVLATPIGVVNFKWLSMQNMILDSPLDLRTIQNSFAWKTRFVIDDLRNMTIQKLLNMKMIFEVVPIDKFLVQEIMNFNDLLTLCSSLISKSFWQPVAGYATLIFMFD